MLRRSYYLTKVEETQYQVDQQKIKQYFPLDTVTKGVLDIYQGVTMHWVDGLRSDINRSCFVTGLLGLRFTERKNAHTWHEEVHCSTCTMAAAEVTSRALS